MIHLSAVLLAGLIDDVRGLRKGAGKVLGSTYGILLPGHSSLKLYLPDALELLLLKREIEGAIFQFLQETVKDSLTGGSGRAGGMR